MVQDSGLEGSYIAKSDKKNQARETRDMSKEMINLRNVGKHLLHVALAHAVNSAQRAFELLV